MLLLAECPRKKNSLHKRIANGSVFPHSQDAYAHDDSPPTRRHGTFFSKFSYAEHGSLIYVFRLRYNALSTTAEQYIVMLLKRVVKRARKHLPAGLANYILISYRLLLCTHEVNNSHVYGPFKRCVIIIIFFFCYCLRPFRALWRRVWYNKYMYKTFSLYVSE